MARYKATASAVESIRFWVPPECGGQCTEYAYGWATDDVAGVPAGPVLRVTDKSDGSVSYRVCPARERDKWQGEDMDFDPWNGAPYGSYSVAVEVV